LFNRHPDKWLKLWQLSTSFSEEKA